MKVNRTQLVESLELVYPAVGISAFVPEFQNFRFYGDKVQATDGVMKIETVLSKDIDLKCSVPAAPFLHLLRSLNDDEVELFLDKDELSVITDKVEGTFSTAPIEKFNPVTIPDKAIHGIYSECITEGFKFCRYGVSKDQTLGPLCGVRLNEKSIFSSDRFRISKWNIEEPFHLPEFGCSLPLKFVNTLIKYEDKLTAIWYVKDKMVGVVLAGGDTQIVTDILTGDYPNLNEYLTSLTKYIKVEFGTGLQDVLERHITFLSDVDSIDKEITIRVEKDLCVFTTSSKSLGTLTEKLKLVHPAETKIEFCINPLLLKDIVNQVSSFKYFVKEKLVLLETENGQCLVQTREG